MIGGLIAEPAVPRECPDEADAAEADEDGPPSHVLEHSGNEQGRDGRAEVGTHEKDALCTAALGRGEPARERSSDVGPRASLADAEQESDREQRDVAEGGGGRNRE